MQKVMGAEDGVPGASVRFSQGFQDLLLVPRIAALKFFTHSDRVHNQQSCSSARGGQNPSLSGLPGLVAQGYRPPTQFSE